MTYLSAIEGSEDQLSDIFIRQSDFIINKAPNKLSIIDTYFRMSTEGPCIYASKLSATDMVIGSMAFSPYEDINLSSYRACIFSEKNGSSKTDINIYVNTDPRNRDITLLNIANAHKLVSNSDLEIEKFAIRLLSYLNPIYLY